MSNSLAINILKLNIENEHAQADALNVGIYNKDNLNTFIQLKRKVSNIKALTNTLIMLMGIDNNAKT